MTKQQFKALEWRKIYDIRKADWQVTYLLANYKGHYIKKLTSTPIKSSIEDHRRAYTRYTMEGKPYNYLPDLLKDLEQYEKE